VFGGKQQRGESPAAALLAGGVNAVEDRLGEFVLGNAPSFSGHASMIAKKAAAGNAPGTG